MILSIDLETSDLVKSKFNSLISSSVGMQWLTLFPRPPAVGGILHIPVLAEADLVAEGLVAELAGVGLLAVVRPAGVDL